MPNHVINLVNMKNIAKKDIFCDDNPECIDFNKLVKMPESLDVPSTSLIPTAIKAYVLYLNQQLRFQQEAFTFIDTMDLIDTLLSIPKETLEEYKNDVQDTIKNTKCISTKSDLSDKVEVDFYTLAEMGRKYLENLFLHGALSWYGWSRKNWGTKWNAYDGFIIDDDTIQYLTAWNPAVPVLLELSRQNPMNEIKLAYMSEDPSCAGRMAFYNGEIIQDDEYKYMSYESIELGKELNNGYDYATDTYPEDRENNPNAFTLIEDYE